MATSDAPQKEDGFGPAPLPALLLEPVVHAALLEDLGRAGDVTSHAVLSADAQMTAELRAREPGVAAGLDCAVLAFELMDPSLEIEQLAPDGARVAPGEVLARIAGSARAILSAERVALNFAGRLSGVATLTARYVELAAGRARILDTRKTTPGLRQFEKFAVRCGGGVNHRFGLYDEVMVKDNHIDASGLPVRDLVSALRKTHGEVVITCEARDEAEALAIADVDAVPDEALAEWVSD